MESSLAEIVAMRAGETARGFALRQLSLLRRPVRGLV